MRPPTTPSVSTPFVSTPLALAAALALAACRMSAAAAPASAPDSAADSLRIRRDIAYLAGDALEGRGTGTAGNDSAAAYIARRLSASGLAPAFTEGRRFLQPFVARSVAAAHAGLAGELPTQNVAA